MCCCYGSVVHLAGGAPGGAVPGRLATGLAEGLATPPLRRLPEALQRNRRRRLRRRCRLGPRRKPRGHRRGPLQALVARSRGKMPFRPRRRRHLAALRKQMPCSGFQVRQTGQGLVGAPGCGIARRLGGARRVRRTSPSQGGRQGGRQPGQPEHGRALAGHLHAGLPTGLAHVLLFQGQRQVRCPQHRHRRRQQRRQSRCQRRQPRGAKFLAATADPETQVGELLSCRSSRIHGWALHASRGLLV
mmetsp:Transcript_107747/g.289756  ORF Transcript_107747/g.289756 Transcript_107747/m.289756 type:complete len:245 (-) Transcript_107747:635-1369(-)